MNLDDLQKPMNSVQFAQLLRKHHGMELPVNQLTVSQTQQMLENVQAKLRKFRNTRSAHLAERNEQYNAMLLIEQALGAKLKEDNGSVWSKVKAAGKAAGEEIVHNIPGASMPYRNPALKPEWSGAGLKGSMAAGTAAQKAGKGLGGQFAASYRAATGKNQKGQALHPPAAVGSVSQGLAHITGLSSTQLSALANKPNLSTSDATTLGLAFKKLLSDPHASSVLNTIHESRQLMLESAMGEAEIILAAKDLADRVQDMVETLGKMINEELPALTETIRDTMEIDQADTFNSSALETLNSTLEAVRSCKEAMDSAARTLAGEELSGGLETGDELADLGDQTSEPPADDEQGLSDTAKKMLKAPDATRGGKNEPLGRAKR